LFFDYLSDLVDEVLSFQSVSYLMDKFMVDAGVYLNKNDFIHGSSNNPNIVMVIDMVFHVLILFDWNLNTNLGQI
jgi:hypothetical protein